MYVIPLLVLILICLAIFFSPILAVVLLAVFLVGLGVYKFFGPGTVPEHDRPPAHAATPANVTTREGTPSGGDEEEESGPWGETWPEKSQ
jgi:hypothetical protein